MTRRKEPPEKTTQATRQNEVVRYEDIFPEDDVETWHIEGQKGEVLERLLVLTKRSAKANRVLLSAIGKVDENGELGHIYVAMLGTMLELGALTLDSEERQCLDFSRAQSSLASKSRPRWWNSPAIKFARQVCQEGPIERAKLVKKTREFLAKISGDRKSEHHTKAVPAVKTLDRFFIEKESKRLLARRPPKKRRALTTQ